MNILDLQSLVLGGNQNRNSPNIPGLGQVNNQGLSHTTDVLGDSLNIGNGLSGMEKFQVGAKGLNSILQGFLGLKQLNLANDQLKFQKDAFNKNFDSQRRLTNAELRDRQATRNIDVAGSTPVDEYMNKYGIQ